MNEYRITTCHSECGTVCLVVAINALDEEDWEVLESFRNRELAESYISGRIRGEELARLTDWT